MLAEAGPTQGDFYAGAMAAVAVILFAKFVTHRGRGDQEKWRWLTSNLSHWICVGAAWLSLVLSLAVLGDMSVRGFGRSFEIKGIEGLLRWTVGVLVVISGGILALDVASLDVTSSGDSRRKTAMTPAGDGNEEPPGSAGNLQPPTGSAPAGPRTAG